MNTEVPVVGANFVGGGFFSCLKVVSTPTTFQSREIVLTRIKGEKLTKIR